MLHAFISRNPSQKHEKGVKSKGGGQGLCRNAVDHIKFKNFDNEDPGHKTLRCLAHHYQKF